MRATGLAAAAQCFLSWGQRCYVNWLLFGKWGRSPSYEQNAPHCHSLALVQDVFHLHSWFCSVQWTNPCNSWLHLWSKWCIERQLLGMSPWRLTHGKCLCRNAGLWVCGGGCYWCRCVCWCVCVLRVSLSYCSPLWSQCIYHSGSGLQDDRFLGIFFFSFLKAGANTLLPVENFLLSTKKKQKISTDSMKHRRSFRYDPHWFLKQNFDGLWWT